MAISRRQFLQAGAMASATITVPHPLFRGLLGSREAHAAPADPYVVLLQLEGGNDGLNTVIPSTGGSDGNAQYNTYIAKRPLLGVPSSAHAPTQIDLDPNGTRLALHPIMREGDGSASLWQLYTEGKVAVVNGVGYASQSLSHFRSEDIWFGALDAATGTFSRGWFGRYLDAFESGLVTFDCNETLHPIFASNTSNVLAVKRIANFKLPDDAEFPDLPAKKAALQAAYAIEAGEPGASLQVLVGQSGDALLTKMDTYATVSTSGFSFLNPLAFELARRLREIAAVIRHDVDGNVPATDARFFHVRIGGFDTHTKQANRHQTLLQQLSRAVGAFWREMEAIGADDRVLVVSFSEFGRRIAENGSSPTEAGTDHGAGSVVLAVGADAQLNGGVHGIVPSLNPPGSAKGNLVFHTDFRRVYATVLQKWLGLSQAQSDGVLAPGSYAPLSFVV